MYNLRSYLKEELFGGKNYNCFQLYLKRFISSEADAIYLIRKLLCDRRKYGKFSTLIYLIRRNILARRYGMQIGRNVEIGIGLKLPHPFGIIIGNGVKIGKNAVIYQQTTFGGKKRGDAQEGKYPKIGDNCVFFAGAKIIGSIVVGNNVTLGANSVLLSDARENSVYAGSPANLVGGEEKCHAQIIQ